MFRQHCRFLCLVAFRIVRDQDTAEDIVQDFLLNLWQRRTDVTSIDSFQAYATRAVKNLSISFLRKQQTLSDEQLNAIPDGANPLEEKEICRPTSTDDKIALDKEGMSATKMVLLWGFTGLLLLCAIALCIRRRGR